MDGKSTREAARLLGLSALYWDDLVAEFYQVDLLDLPIHRYLSIVHGWFLRNRDQEGRDMLSQLLNEPFDWESSMTASVSASGDDEIAMMRAAMGA